MALGTAMAASQNFSAIFSLQVGGFNLAAYAAHYALIANLVVAALTPVFSALAGKGADETSEEDYPDQEEATEGENRTEGRAGSLRLRHGGSTGGCVDRRQRSIGTRSNGALRSSRPTPAFGIGDRREG